MLVWAIYDISHNGTRAKVAEKCKDYGLERLQKSAFFGELNKEHRAMMGIEIKEILESGDSGGDDCVFILPMCSSCLDKKITIGRGFNEDEFKESFFRYFG